MESDDVRLEGCVVTPGWGGNALIAAVDGEADEATLAHLRLCPHCAASVEQGRALQRRLRRQLYRLFCPATDTLVDYCQGLLDPCQRAVVAHHLALCPLCAEEVALLERGAALPADLLGYSGSRRLAGRLLR